MDYLCTMNPMLFRLFRDLETRVHELNYLFWECTTRCHFHCRIVMLNRNYFVFIDFILIFCCATTKK